MLHSFIFSPLEQFSFTRAQLDEVNNDNSQRCFQGSGSTGGKGVALYSIVPEALRDSCLYRQSVTRSAFALETPKIDAIQIDSTVCGCACVMCAMANPACGGQNTTCALGFSFHLLVSSGGQVSQWQALYPSPHPTPPPSLLNHPNINFKISV